MKLKALILFLLIFQNIGAWPFDTGNGGTVLVAVTFPISLPILGCAYGISKICVKYEKYSEAKKQKKEFAKKTALTQTPGFETPGN